MTLDIRVTEYRISVPEDVDDNTRRILTNLLRELNRPCW